MEEKPFPEKSRELSETENRTKKPLNGPGVWISFDKVIPESFCESSKVHVGHIRRDNIIKFVPGDCMRVETIKIIKELKRSDMAGAKHLATYYQIIKDEAHKNWVIEMKDYKGQSLNYYTKKRGKRFKQKEIIAFLEQIVEVFKYVHGKELVLRALSPDHIFLKEKKDGSVTYKIGGLEYLGRKGDSQPPYKGAEYNLNFIPADLGPNYDSYDVKSDYYALGIILCEMITGSPSVSSLKSELKEKFSEYEGITGLIFNLIEPKTYYLDMKMIEKWIDIQKIGSRSNFIGERLLDERVSNRGVIRFFEGSNEETIFKVISKTEKERYIATSELLDKLQKNISAGNKTKLHLYRYVLYNPYLGNMYIEMDKYGERCQDIFQKRGKREKKEIKSFSPEETKIFRESFQSVLEELHGMNIFVGDNFPSKIAVKASNPEEKAVYDEEEKKESTKGDATEGEQIEGITLFGFEDWPMDKGKDKEKPTEAFIKSNNEIDNDEFIVLFNFEKPESEGTPSSKTAKAAVEENKNTPQAKPIIGERMQYTLIDQYSSSKTVIKLPEKGDKEIITEVYRVHAAPLKIADTKESKIAACKDDKKDPQEYILKKMTYDARIKNQLAVVKKRIGIVDKYVATYIDAWEDENWFYVVRECGTRVGLDRNFSNQAEAKVFLEQMIDGVKTLHDKKVRIRALSPDHILITVKEPDGAKPLEERLEYKIAGLEYSVEEKGTYQRPYESSLSINYIPYSLRSKPDPWTTNADIYSLGSTVYSMCHGATICCSRLPDKKRPISSDFNVIDCFVNEVLVKNLTYVPSLDRLQEKITTLPEINGDQYYLIKDKSMSAGKNPVYKAIRKDNEIVVIKVPLSKEELEKEISFRKSMPHPQILPIDSYDSRCIIMQERVELTAYLKGGVTLDEFELMQIAWALIGGIHLMHSQLLIHRDIKPANIYLVIHPTMKKVIDAIIGDFGEYTKGSVFYSTVGTDCYLAPEIVFKETPANNKVDIWDYGLVLYYLITKTHVKQGKSTADFEKIIKDIHNELLGKKVPILAGIIDKCLKIRSSERPSASDILFYDCFKNMKTYITAVDARPENPKPKKTEEIRMADEANCGEDVKTQEANKRYNASINTWLKLNGCTHIQKLVNFYIYSGELCLIAQKLLQKDALNNLDLSTLKRIDKINIAYQLIKGIHEMHARNIIHRKLTPSVIYWNKKKKEKESTVTIGGLVQAKVDNSIQTIIYVPTDIYMAKIYHPSNIPRKSWGPLFAYMDIWSYGAILYYLMFGTHLDYDKSQTKEKIALGDIRYDEKRGIDCLCEIMKECLKDYGLNSRTSADLEAEIKKHLDELKR